MMLRFRRSVPHFLKRTPCVALVGLPKRPVVDLTPNAMLIRPAAQLVVTWHISERNQSYRGTAAGEGFSTVDDLSRFASALVDNKLLDAEHTHLLLSK